MKIRYLILMIVTCFFTSLNQDVKAAENSEIPFSIEAIHPDNQVNSNQNANYLDLIVKPDTTQTISFIVKNSSTTTQHFIVELADATTSNGLSIDYSKTANYLIKSPKISEMISSNETSKKLTIPANTSVQVDFSLTYPKEAIQGVVLGGVSIFQDPDYVESTATSGININNRYRYELAVQLRSSEDKNNIKPDIKLTSVSQSIDNSHPIVKTTLQNINPAVISQVSTHSVVKNQAGEIINEYKTSLGQVAPISQFDLKIPLEDGALKPGTYNVSGELISNKTNDKWTWSQDFTVDNTNYQETNDKNINKKTDWSFLLWILFLLMLVIILYLLFIIWKRRKQDEESNQNN